MENSSSVETSHNGICSIDGCSEPLVSNINLRYKGTFLCRKHRNQSYKENYKKKSKEFANEFEECEKIFSGSPKPMHGQLLADMLQQVLMQKRLELVESPEIVHLMQHYQKMVQSSVKERNEDFQLPPVKITKREPKTIKKERKSNNKTIQQSKRKLSQCATSITDTENEQKSRISPSVMSEDTNLSTTSQSTVSAGDPSLTFQFLRESPNLTNTDECLASFTNETEDININSTYIAQPVESDINTSTSFADPLNFSAFPKSTITSHTFSPKVIQGPLTLSRDIGQEATHLPIKQDLDLEQNIFTMSATSAFLKTGAGRVDAYLSLPKSVITSGLPATNT